MLALYSYGIEIINFFNGQTAVTIQAFTDISTL